MPKTTINSAGKVLRVLKALRGHSLNGIGVKQIADQVGQSPSQVHRALQTLVAEGLVRQDDNGNYTLGTALLQIAKAHDHEIQRAEARIAELKQRAGVIY